MRKAVLAGVLLAGSMTASAAMAANAEVEAPIHQFIDASAAPHFGQLAGTAGVSSQAGAGCLKSGRLYG